MALFDLEKQYLLRVTDTYPTRHLVFAKNDVNLERQSIL